MTDRATFLATVRATPRGSDPGLLDRSAAPPAPTELRAGEDPVDRFQREAELVSTSVLRVPAAAVGTTVAGLLVAAGAQRVAATADLASHLAAVVGACAAEGIDAEAYAEVAPDRGRAGALDATVTGCAAAVAATGSIVTTASGAGRAGALIAPMHVCVVEQGQIVEGLHALFAGSALVDAGSLLALQAGPSRSADIEKVLILGVPGPGDVHVVIVEG